jgi:hypothetical protein
MMQPPPYGNSHDLLLAVLRQQVRDQDIEGKILELLQSGFERALRVESAVLARSERERLFRTVMGEVLNKVTERINKDDHA